MNVSSFCSPASSHSQASSSSSPSPLPVHSSQHCTCSLYAVAAAAASSSSTVLSSSSSSLSARVSRLKEILSLLCVCLSNKKRKKKTKESGCSMGAEDAFANSTNSQFLLTNSSPTTSATTSASSSPTVINNGASVGIISGSCGGGNGSKGIAQVDVTTHRSQNTLNFDEDGREQEGNVGSNDIIVTEADLLRQQNRRPVIRFKSVSIGNEQTGGPLSPSDQGGNSVKTSNENSEATPRPSGVADSVQSITNNSRSDKSAEYVGGGGGASVGGCASCNVSGVGGMDSGGGAPVNSHPHPSANCASGLLEENGSSNNSILKMGASSVGIEGEWHQKYAFIVGLLRKPHVLLVKESLSRERDKLCNKLSAYRLERNIVRESINKYIQNGSESSAQQSLTAQIKHLDMMCVTLERQIDVLGNVDHALPVTENIYSGEPDSLDGTSSEIMPHDDNDDDDEDDVDLGSRRHLSDGSTGNGGGIHSNSNNNNNHHMSSSNNHHHRSTGFGASGGGFQLQINGRSPLDALAMLHLERCAHRETRKELNQLRKKYELLRDEFDSGEGLSQSTSLLFSRLNGDLEEDEMFSNDLNGGDHDPGAGEMSIGTDESNSRLVGEVKLKDVTISQLRNRLIHLERARMDKVPVDAAREIAKLHVALVQLERVRDELTLQNFTLKSKLAELSARISDSATYRLEKPITNNNNNNINNINKSGTTAAAAATGAALKSTSTLNSNPVSSPNGLPTKATLPAPPSPSPTSQSAQFHSDEGMGTSNSTTGPTTATEDLLRLRRKSTYKISHNVETNGEIKQLRSLINDLHAKEVEYQRKLSALETELRNLKNQYADECASRKESDRIIRQLEEQLEITQRKLEETERTFLTKEEECSAIKLDVDTLNEENRRLKDDLNMLHLKVEKEQSRSIEKLSKFEKELGCILEANRSLQEDCHRERLMRKKYHNLVEELKGKIRVFCRIRPPSKNEKLANEIVAKCSDPYTISLDTPKGHKEYQFDRVFTPDDGQDEIFADTQNLIQSAFDGYNVCICAYGQTGSGKTYTILGDDAHPGIAPRTFAEVFLVAEEMSPSYETVVSFYVLELYNDRLIDLLSSSGSGTSQGTGESDKLEIRRDRRGTVWVSGARVLPAENSSSLEKNFRQALTARHTAATKMNDRSSRSHLVVGIIIETTSKINGTVLRGKISLVDLAGSERTGKSGVSADTLREANAINKSLSAFGDVINALTTDQAFVPYRNNKLTLLMQDSIGGNAKTLMFVNISPCSYNLEETVISLSYGQRLKQVTNGATRNAESREVARLKNIIHRMRRGEQPSEAEDAFM